MRSRARLASLLAPLAVVLAASPAHADEGMWPFNMVPVDAIKKDHGVALTPAWLDHVRLASVRLNVGGSGSFVSSRGLVLTNHHVASDCIAKLATPSHDFLKTGYVSGKDGGEAACPDLEINQLVKIDDVTDKVKAARQPNMNDADANVAMKGAMSQIEKACKDAAGPSFRCDVVTLYGGGKYDLYTYKKFTDVRLVFAPEQEVAFFGGDPENFTYPRYDLDLALFRVYENGQPVHPSDFLRWDPTGPKDGDVVFTSGSPGHTDRQKTIAQLEVYRDALLPYALDRLATLRQALEAWAASYGDEGAREIRELIFNVQNSEKAIGGELRGLRDPALMNKKRAEENALRAAVDKDPTLKAQYGSTWDDIAKVQKAYAQTFKRYGVLEGGPRAEVAGIARTLVRLAAELQKPNDTRLREYRDSALDSLKQELFSDAPVYGNVDLVRLRLWLEALQRDAPDVAKVVLAGKTPRAVAEETMAKTRLSDVYVRRAIEAGGQAAIDASTDPMIVMMRTIDAEARAVRKRMEDEVEGPMRTSSRKIADATFAVKGTSVYPDATFTLRLSVGVVKGYKENGRDVPWSTDLAGMFAHATGKPPLALPQRWLDAKASLTPTTPLDFVSTNDTTGGNSGSPLVNASGNLVGLLFDGNLSSLANDFEYGDTTQRSVNVDTAAMLEALTKVYGAQAIAAELLGQ